MHPILESHDRTAFEIYLYDDSPRLDAFTERLRPLADAWHRVRGMPDAQLAEKIRADRIDVLVDLAGHTAGNRLLTFARRPAPVQISYLGYPNTTGLNTVDYRLTDAVADPPGLADELHTEKLVRLPGTFLTFRPPVETPEVVDPPVLKNGFVTFGSFNALWKVNAPLLQLWARVLRAVPDSRLMMKAEGLEEPDVAHRIANVFRQAGIDVARVRLLGREATYAGHLAAYGTCDVCLDTFPYAGTTTTCEALWMGVPVVSLAGEVHASRVGASLLSSVGLSEFAAPNAGAFVATAANLAGQPERLRELRRTMRERLRGSPLMNPIGLTRAIETAYRAARPPSRSN
jgi:predicted O-linked N-acetylglucosamine transferase (SPINDLY family)